MDIYLTVSDRENSQPIYRGTISLKGSAVNDRPELSNIDLLQGAVQYQPYTITYEQLLAASDVEDIDSNTITFNITQLNSGSLSKNGQPVTIGETLALGEELTWTSHSADATVPAFTVQANDGESVSRQEVAVNVSVAKTSPQKVGDELQVNTYTEQGQKEPSITGLADGGYLVTWQSNEQDGSDWGIYGQRYDSKDNPVGDEFLINTYTNTNQVRPSVASLSDGGFVVSWESYEQDGDVEGIFAQQYNRDGNPVGNEFPVHTQTRSLQRRPAIASLTDGGYVITWQSYYVDGNGEAIVGQRYDGEGNPIGSNFQVNTYTESGQVISSATGLENGGFVVTWLSTNQDGDSWGIYGQMYDREGNPVGNEFQVNTYTDSTQGYPSVTNLSDGGFVVTWYSNGQDGSGSGIYGQKYDSAGNLVGNEFQINTYTTGSQSFPSVSSLPNGGFVVTWQSNGQDGDSLGIYGQAFDSKGNFLGGEFPVNNYTAGIQTLPEVATLSNGDFVITWQSEQQDGSEEGIYLQRFTVASPQIPDNSWVNQLGTASPDEAYGVTVDQAGNVYLAGTTQASLDGNTNASGIDATNQADPFLTKYDASGNKLWTIQPGTTGFDYFTDIALDQAGNVYTVGYDDGAGAVLGDIKLAKYDSNGQEIFNKLFRGNNLEWSRDIAIDKSGNIYIAGVAIGDNDQALVAKFDSDGELTWQREFGTDQDESARSVIVDEVGNVYVAGTTTGSLDGNTNAGETDVFLTKFSNVGEQLWTQQLGTPEVDGGSIQFRKDVHLARDGEGSIYLAGTTEGDLNGNTNAGRQDAFVVKFDDQGQEIWTRQLGTANDDKAWGITVDDQDVINLTGETVGSLNNQPALGKEDVFVVSFDKNGNQLQTQLLGTPESDKVNDIFIDRSNNIYLAGRTTGSLGGDHSGDRDAWVAKN